MLEGAGADRVLTMDLHAGQIQGFFRIPVDHMTALPLFAQYFRDKGLSGEKVVSVSPDPGRAKMARKFGQMLSGAEGETDLAIMNKSRPAHDQASITQVIGEVEGKVALMGDDMIATGSTLIAAVDALKSAGATAVYVFATHGHFAGNAFERLADADLAEIVVTDTVPIDPLHAAGQPHGAADLEAPRGLDLERLLGRVGLRDLRRREPALLDAGPRGPTLRAQASRAMRLDAAGAPVANVRRRAPLALAGGRDDGAGGRRLRSCPSSGRASSFAPGAKVLHDRLLLRTQRRGAPRAATTSRRSASRRRPRSGSHRAERARSTSTTPGTIAQRIERASLPREAAAGRHTSSAVRRRRRRPRSLPTAPAVSREQRVRAAAGRSTPIYVGAPRAPTSSIVDAGARRGVVRQPDGELPQRLPARRPAAWRSATSSWSWTSRRAYELLERAVRAARRGRAAGDRSTVSPVPLSATFSGYGRGRRRTRTRKAVLRGLARSGSPTLPSVDYFPAYEMVELAWPRELRSSTTCTSRTSSSGEIVQDAASPPTRPTRRTTGLFLARTGTRLHGISTRSLPHPAADLGDRRDRRRLAAPLLRASDTGREIVNMLLAVIFWPLVLLAPPDRHQLAR